MHEYAVVEDLVATIEAQAHSRRVERIRLRRDSTFAEEPLRQAFAMLAARTPLESAVLDIEERRVRRACARCGRAHTIAAGDLLGHTYVCPDCGFAAEIDEAHGLKLIGIEYAEDGARIRDDRGP